MKRPKLTEETKKKISLTKKGNSPIPKSAFKKGHVPWNKGKKWNKDIVSKFKKAHTGKKLSENHKKNIGIAGVGRTVSEETRAKISASSRREKHWNWKGGKAGESLLERKNPLYKKWRTAILERDNYTCVWCKKHGGKLVADHKVAWSKSPKLRFEISNGRTLCEECHRKTPNFGGKANRKNVFISVMIPTYTISDELEELAIRCALSYRGQVDQLIICEDGGRFSKDLMSLSDIYAFNKDNVGFTANVNRGWSLATGEFVFIVNSDTFLLKGKLKDLCIPGKVVSPLLKNQYIDRLAGPFWVTPRTVTKERGMLMEELKTYFSDSEYDERVKDIFQKVESVEIYHHQAKTVSAAGVEGGEEQQRDREIYANLIEEGRAK